MTPHDFDPNPEQSKRGDKWYRCRRCGTEFTPVYGGSGRVDRETLNAEHFQYLEHSAMDRENEDCDRMVVKGVLES